MITVKIIVFFFKVKLFDSYFFGELKIPVLLLPPKSSLWNEDSRFNSRNREKTSIHTKTSVRFSLSGHWFEGPRILGLKSNGEKIFS
jgi:hypothetical protein